MFDWNNIADGIICTAIWEAGRQAYFLFKKLKNQLVNGNSRQYAVIEDPNVLRNALLFPFSELLLKKRL